ncbi:MAG TPA: Mur ligase domain-containing protein, partial [Candidatus Limnocylindrales bacterium]
MTASYATLAGVTDPRPMAPAGGGGADLGFSGDDLAAATGGRLLKRSERPILGAAVDSRSVVPGNLFVALPGERTDGHRFVGAALEGGAAAVLVATAPD